MIWSTTRCSSLERATSLCVASSSSSHNGTTRTKSKNENKITRTTMMMRTTMMRRRFVVLARCSKKRSSILLTRRGRNENTSTTCNAWNNDDHEFYGTGGADEEENTGSLDEGDTFEGEQYLRASESLREKTIQYEEENGESTHVLPSLLFPVAEPLIPGQRKVLHLYEPRFVSLLNDSVETHGGLLAFVHYSQIPPSRGKSAKTRGRRVLEDENEDDEEEEKVTSSSNSSSIDGAMAGKTEREEDKLNQRPLPKERAEKLEVFGEVSGDSDSDDSDYEEEFERFSEFARKVNSRYGDEAGFGSADDDEEDDEEDYYYDDDDDDDEEETQAVQLNASCTLGRVIHYEPIKVLSSDDFDDGVSFDIVDERGESSSTFGETYRVLVVGETRMMVEDVNETPAGYVAGTYSLVNSPDSKFAAQPTQDERKEIEQLADDVELLMNYVIEFSDKLLEVSNVTKETLFDDIVRKAENARDYPTEIHRKFAIEEAKMVRWAKAVGKVDSLHESMKWVEEDGVFFDAKIELENVARMKRDQDKAGLSLDDAILSRLRRSAALTMTQNEDEDEDEKKTTATDLKTKSRASAMVRAERLSFAAFQEVPFSSEAENEKLIARRAAAMSTSRGLVDRLRLAKFGLEEQLGGLRAKLALEKSLRAMLDGNTGSSSSGDTTNDTNTKNKEDKDSDENKNNTRD